MRVKSETYLRKTCIQEGTRCTEEHFRVGLFAGGVVFCSFFCLFVFQIMNGDAYNSTVESGI